MAIFVDGGKYCVRDLPVDLDRGGSMQGFHAPLYVALDTHIFIERSSWKPKDCLVDASSQLPM